MPVDVVHYNPPLRRPGLLKYLLPKRPIGNFGDLIGPIIVGQMVEQFGLRQPSGERRLVAVGSIMKLTQPGDVVWGAGVNGKSMSAGAAPDIDVRAVRGPRTRDLLVSLGTRVPEIYGDPALLWNRFWPRDWYRLKEPQRAHRAVTVIPNFHDLPLVRDRDTLSPLGDPHDLAREIAFSDFVCGSSLHGVILAESFGIPARLVVSSTEPSFKYDDYYSGTGRSSYTPAASVKEAIEMGGEPPAVFDADALLRAFPQDLYVPGDA